MSIQNNRRRADVGSSFMEFIKLLHMAVKSESDCGGRIERHFLPIVDPVGDLMPRIARSPCQFSLFHPRPLKQQPKSAVPAGVCQPLFLPSVIHDVGFIVSFTSLISKRADGISAKITGNESRQKKRKTLLL